MPNLINKRRNGGDFVKIWDDGTKERFSINDDPPEYPESIDLKITNYCDFANVCTYCHESSNIQGNVASATGIKRICNSFPEGTELAIGGGNPLSHPDTKEILKCIKSNNQIANMTVNQLHVNKMKHYQMLRDLFKKSFIKGLGISYRSEANFDITLSNLKTLNDLRETTKNEVNENQVKDNTVFHMIAGVNSPDDLEMIDAEIDEANFLVLGYKTAGRGEDHMMRNASDVGGSLDEWRFWLKENAGNYKMSFDNLAINQLGVRDMASDSFWDRHYLGNEGQYTMYIDAVEKEFAVSSFSDKTWSLDSVSNMREAFQKVREESNGS